MEEQATGLIDSVDGISAIGGMIVTMAIFLWYQWHKDKIVVKDRAEDRAQRAVEIQADREARATMGKECHDTQKESTKAVGEMTGYLSTANRLTERLLERQT